MSRVTSLISGFMPAYEIGFRFKKSSYAFWAVSWAEAVKKRLKREP